MARSFSCRDSRRAVCSVFLKRGVATFCQLRSSPGCSWALLSLKRKETLKFWREEWDSLKMKRSRVQSWWQGCAAWVSNGAGRVAGLPREPAQLPVGEPSPQSGFPSSVWGSLWSADCFLLHLGSLIWYVLLGAWPRWILLHHFPPSVHLLFWKHFLFLLNVTVVVCWWLSFFFILVFFTTWQVTAFLHVTHLCMSGTEISYESMCNIYKRNRGSRHHFFYVGWHFN